jgi:SAM-dependent methyltransferase
MADVYDDYRDEFRARVLGGRPRSILEVGAGDGAFLKTVAGQVSRLTGLDPDPGNVANLKLEGFEAVEGVAERLPFADGEFDIVVFSFTPHHVSDWNAALSEAMRVARNGVEILDVWYDESIADQRTAATLDRWYKTIDRRTGMVHNEVLSPGALLAPVIARRDVTYDYACRRIASALDIAETLEHGRAKLAKVDNDAALAREFDEIIAAARRDGMTDEGAILMTIEKRR